jgi:two-component system LytT family response regulator
MILRALVVDDEAPGRENLCAILKSYFPDVNVVDTAATYEDAEKKISVLKPDLLFLDIQLGMQSGLDLLKSLKNPQLEVVIVTAYDQYAVKAFRTIASDYIMKPVDIDELKTALDRIRENIELKSIRKRLEERNLSGKKSGTLKVNATDGIELIPYDEILYIQSFNYYGNVVLTNQREIITSRHLKDYEEQLNGHGFFRIHNSYIVNVSHITGIFSEDGFFVSLRTGKSIKISRRRKDEFISYMEKMQN